jgi:hypothetical protein
MYFSQTRAAGQRREPSGTRSTRRKRIRALSVEAEILAHLGDAHGAAGNIEDARTVWWRSLEILSDFGHRDAERVRAKLRKLGMPKPAPGQEL